MDHGSGARAGPEHAPGTRQTAPPGCVQSAPRQSRPVPACLSLLRAPWSLDFIQVRPVANVPHKVQPECDCLFWWWRRQNPEICRLAIWKDERGRAEYAGPIATREVIVLDLLEQRSVFEVGREPRQIELSS